MAGLASPTPAPNNRLTAAVGHSPPLAYARSTPDRAREGRKYARDRERAAAHLACGQTSVNLDVI